VATDAGDRVASYLPNRVETVVAFLACACIGAIWSSCAPDMGASVVLDRLRQIEPKLLLATGSTRYNGKTQDRAAVVDDLLRELPSVKTVVHVDGSLAAQRAVAWRDRTPWTAAVRGAAFLINAMKDGVRPATSRRWPACARPTRPARRCRSRPTAGEIQCVELGVAAYAFNDAG
jgi:acyl-CoA synthetase (AMP-forming)/AMP-acid ligase II